MAYLNNTVKVFVAIFLVFIIIWMVNNPSFAAWCLVVVPFVIVYQAYVILKADTEPDKKFEDDWYDHE